MSKPAYSFGCRWVWKPRSFDRITLAMRQPLAIPQRQHKCLSAMSFNVPLCNPGLQHVNAPGVEYVGGVQEYQTNSRTQHASWQDVLRHLVLRVNLTLPTSFCRQGSALTSLPHEKQRGAFERAFTHEIDAMLERC